MTLEQSVARAPHRALSMFDVCMAICEHLDGDKPSLYAALRTCRIWAAAATRVLWRAPPFHALRQKPSDSRHLYGPVVRRLALPVYSNELYALRDQVQIEQWAFPGLRELEVKAGETAFSMFGSLWTVLHKSGGSLVAVVIRSCPEQQCSRRFPAKVFRVAHQHSGQGNNVDDNDNGNGNGDGNDEVTAGFGLRSVLAELGKGLRLTTLTVEIPVSPTLLRCFVVTAVDTGAAPLSPTSTTAASTRTGISGRRSGPKEAPAFSRLRHLSVRLRPQAVPALLRSSLTATITSLDIVYLPTFFRGSAVSALSSLRNRLTSLSIAFTARYVLCAGDLAALRAMPRVTRLRLRDASVTSSMHFSHGWCPAIDAHCLTDAALQELLACWPHMVELELACDARLTVAAVRLVGQACRRMQKLRLDGARCNIKDLGKGLHKLRLAPQPLFPELESLWMVSAGFFVPDER
jgi:hypothetical protein